MSRNMENNIGQLNMVKTSLIRCESKDWSVDMAISININGFLFVIMLKCKKMATGSNLGRWTLIVIMRFEIVSGAD